MMKEDYNENLKTLDKEIKILDANQNISEILSYSN